MKFTLVTIAALAAIAGAVPARQHEPYSPKNGFDPVVIDHAFSFDAEPRQIDLPDLDAGQCRVACKTTGALATFCGRIPNPVLLVACNALGALLNTPAGQTACTNWCDDTF